jgi:hypothetical protein
MVPKRRSNGRESVVGRAALETLKLRPQREAEKTGLLPLVPEAATRRHDRRDARLGLQPCVKRADKRIHASE